MAELIKLTSGSYNFSASYQINEEHNGIEISFTEKPGDIIRNELKRLGFRWHSQKKVWYARNTKARLDLAERLANREENIKALSADSREQATRKFEKVQDKQTGLVIPPAKFVDGGGLYDGWKGGNNNSWRTDKELKALILADFKRAGISATIRFGRGGYLTSLTVTIKLTPEDIASFEEFNEKFTIRGSGWMYYTDESGKVKDIFADNFWSMTGAARDEMEENIRRTEYRRGIERLTESGNCHSGRIDVLNERGNKKFETVQAIVNSYNRDCSNSMVDYFDRDIYDWYTFKIA